MLNLWRRFFHDILDVISLWLLLEVDLCVLCATELTLPNRSVFTIGADRREGGRARTAKYSAADVSKLSRRLYNIAKTVKVRYKSTNPYAI
jgi:hypothetical protein